MRALHMKSLKIFSIIWLAAMLVVGLGYEAQAAKTIEVGTATVINTADEALRTKDLPIMLKGGFDDVNGLAFTLLYDKAVFEFIGLVQNTTPIDDGATYDPEFPPSPATVAGSIYYQANNKADQGRVLIAAASANFLAGDTAEVIPFKARFRVKVGQGNDFYPFNLQQTIIGPDTAAAAGYDVPTAIPIAVGLAPTADPTTASAFPVTLVAGGGITVSGGYTISGSVQYEGGTPANGAEVRLLKKVDGIYGLNATTLVASGNFSFANKSAGTYKLVVLANNPGFQRSYESADITIGAAYNAGTITLAEFSPLVGTITVNGLPIAGVKAKVMIGATLIGYFSVDANGNFVTPPLDPAVSYTITAKYGSMESDAFTGTYNWSLAVGTLSGTVSGLTTGQDVMLHIVSATAQLEKTLAKTAAGDVTYQFVNLLPATDYIVSIVGDGIPVSYYDGSALMGVSDITAAAEQAVIADTDTSGINFDFTDQSVKTIEGTIGVVGVPVFALETTTFAIYSVLSGAGGDYGLDVEDGTYNVFAFNNGKTFYYNSGGTTQVEAEAGAVVVSGSNVSGIDISLDEQTGVITGQVTYRRLGGDPVAGIMVTADGPKGSAVAVTDESGNYTLTGLFNEAYNVTIYPNAPYPRQTKSVTASPEGTVQNFVIHTGWVFSGTVGNGSAPIVGAWIYLINSSGNIQGVPAFSDAGGIFTLADIPAGVYTLKAEHPDYQPKSVSLDIQADISGYVLTLVAGGKISGTVTDGAIGLSNVMIIATAVGETARYAFTDGNGGYELNGLISGTMYFLRVSKQGYLTQFVQETAAADTVRNFTLQAPANRYNFGGTVQETGGSPIVGAIVVVSSSANNFAASTITAAGGAFSFSQLVAAADYKIVVIPGNNRPVYIVEGYNLSAEKLDYVINIPTGSINGTITLSDSATGADVTVYLIDAAGNYVTDVTAVDAGGGAYTYSFGGVQAATDFKVVTFAPGYGLGWYGGADFAGATAVQSGTSGVNITLTP